MAALAVPLIEGAAMALLRALGVVAVAGAGAAVVNEAAKKKAESAERAKATPIAQAGSQTKTRDTCTKCPPDCGTLVARKWNMSEDARAYQARITGFAPLTEWSFGGTDFDGFKSQACLLLEAKARYDQFFLSGQQPKFFFNITGRVKIMSQASKQSAVIDASPPAQLHWHFMQPLSHAYFTQAFRAAFLPIITVLTP
jgi:anaerobic selenocysteine-containing dehydrogenase